MVTLVILHFAILATACFFHRRGSEREDTQVVNNIQNAAYVGDAQPGHDNQYDEPLAVYAKLDSSKRVPVDKDADKKNAKRYASLNVDTNAIVKPEDSVYKIILYRLLKESSSKVLLFVRFLPIYRLLF